MMGAARFFDRIVSRYGQETTITPAGGEAFTLRALVQPVRSKAKAATEGAGSGLGQLDVSDTVLLAPADGKLAAGDGVVSDGGKRYRVRRAERIFADEAAYVWALLRPEGEGAPWSS